MKSFRKYLIIVFALALMLSMSITVYGASGGKTTYLLTKEKYNEYDPNQETIDEKRWTKYKYNKYGLMKSIVWSPDSYGYSEKWAFVYNSKKKAVKVNELHYYDGDVVNRYCRKYSYNKRGYVSRVKVYWIDRGRYDLCSETKLTWNKKGQITKIRELDDKGKTDSTDSYTYNKKGQLIKTRHYDASDKKYTTTRYKYNQKGELIKQYYKDDPACTEWIYDGDKVTEIEYTDKSNNEIMFINYKTYENGNIMKETQYDCMGGEDNKHKNSSCKYEYRKIKLSSKYRKLVRKQQICLPYM
ncbi:MAG: hypothetical protein IJJ06_00430 [Mogibacterium sp.]|nr:hypothetical protein [Mogibacterium sp.]